MIIQYIKCKHTKNWYEILFSLTFVGSEFVPDGEDQIPSSLK